MARAYHIYVVCGNRPNWLNGLGFFTVKHEAIAFRDKHYPGALIYKTRDGQHTDWTEVK